MNGVNDEAAVRLKYVRSFNDTMGKIWRERIALLGVINTGALYNSIRSVKFITDSDASEVSFAWQFLGYGEFQDRGTGKEVPIGNPGDIGRPKVRERRPWLSPAFYSSSMNLKEFMTESINRQTLHIFSDLFDNPVKGDL